MPVMLLPALRFPNSIRDQSCSGKQVKFGKMDLKVQAVNYGSQLPALLENLSTAHKLTENCPVESKCALYLDAIVIE